MEDYKVYTKTFTKLPFQQIKIIRKRIAIWRTKAFTYVCCIINWMNYVEMKKKGCAVLSYSIIDGVTMYRSSEENLSAIKTEC